MMLYDYLSKNNFRKDVDEMIFFDYLINNIDRHEFNFGIIRNPDTLEFISFCPLFDSGSSLNFNGISIEESKPFKSNKNEQIKIISQSSLNNINNIDIKFVKNIIEETYEYFKISNELTNIAMNEFTKNYHSLYDKIINLDLDKEER